MRDVSKQNGDVAVASDFYPVFSDQDNLIFIFRVYEALVPQMKRPTALCTP